MPPHCGVGEAGGYDVEVLWDTVRGRGAPVCRSTGPVSERPESSGGQGNGWCSRLCGVLGEVLY